MGPVGTLTRDGGCWTEGGILGTFVAVWNSTILLKIVKSRFIDKCDTSVTTKFSQEVYSIIWRSTQLTIMLSKVSEHFCFTHSKQFTYLFLRIHTKNNKYTLALAFF